MHAIESVSGAAAAAVAAMEIVTYRCRRGVVMDEAGSL